MPHKIKLASLILGTVLGLFLIDFSYEHTKNSAELERLALGNENKEFYEKTEELNHHCRYIVVNEGCHLEYNKHGKKNDVIFWLGNSQLHAINQYKIGDKTGSSILHELLKINKKYLLTISQPNINMQELNIIFNQSIELFPVELLIICVVFDDMREDGIRDNLKYLTEQNNFENKKFNQVAPNNQIDSNVDNKDILQVDSKDNLQLRVENYFSQKLSIIYPKWDARGELRGNFFLALYNLRNFVFGITPSTTRKLIPARYNKNMESFDEILKIAKEKKISVITYIAPLRNDVKIPYDLSQYENFKSEIKNISLKHQANFFNWEDIVDNSSWGQKNSTSIKKEGEIDFMHFQFSGHKKIASKLYETIHNIIIN